VGEIARNELFPHIWGFSLFLEAFCVLAIAYFCPKNSESAEKCIKRDLEKDSTLKLSKST